MFPWHLVPPCTSPAPFFFPLLIMSLCLLISFLFHFSHSPHLHLPISLLPSISFGLWPHLRLLIHCSVSRSIERLSVRRSHCAPVPPSPASPVSPQTADTPPAGKPAFYIPYWRASPLLSAHPTLFSSLGHFSSLHLELNGEEKKCMAP